MARCDRARDEAGAADGGHLRRHPGAPGAARLARPRLPVKVPKWQKLWIALRHGLRGDGRVHVVGAGLAGLATAVALARRGIAATLYEAGPAAGGRCRSYFDRGLGRRIDNGNHLLLSGNRAAMAYLDTIGARAGPGRAGAARFPFVDLASGERWTIAPEPRPAALVDLPPRRRVPGTAPRDYLALLRLRRARRGCDGGRGARTGRGRSTGGCWSRWRWRR